MSKVHLHDAIRQLRAEELGIDDTTLSSKYSQDLNAHLHEEALITGRAAWQAYLFENAEHEAEVEVFVRDGLTNLARAMLEQDKSLDHADIDHIIIWLKEPKE